jgi:hypothetical protein
MVNRKDIVVVLSIIVSVFLFLTLTGTITSGYHFVDDHEVIKIKHDLKSSSLNVVTKKWVIEDLTKNTRFRPLYSIHRVLQTKILGSDFLLWSLYNGVLCCLAIISFFLGMRNMAFSIGESVTFLIIAFIGPQSSVWWRLGPGESLGMVFLSLSFYFMSKTSDKKNYLLNNLFFILFLILSSLTKESFMIIVPGMIVFKIWNDKNRIWFSFKDSVYRNMILIVPLIVLLIELYVIRRYVGTSYAGLDSNIISNITRFLFNSIHFVKIYLNLFIACLLLFISNWFINRRLIKFNLFSIVVFVLVFAPNVILYNSTGLEERYLLPVTFGLGFLIVTYINGFEDSPGWFKKVAIALVIFSLIPFIHSSYAEAVKFTEEGVQTQKLLTAISANFIPGNQVIAVADPVESYEYSVSLQTYLYYEDKIDLFGYALISKEKSEQYQDYVEGWKSYFKGRQSNDLTSKPQMLIFFDNHLTDEFFASSKLSGNDFLQIDIGQSPFALFEEIRK